MIVDTFQWKKYPVRKATIPVCLSSSVLRRVHTKTSSTVTPITVTHHDNLKIKKNPAYLLVNKKDIFIEYNIAYLRK